jgi:hypothetical protein
MNTTNMRLAIAGRMALATLLVVGLHACGPALPSRSDGASPPSDTVDESTSSSALLDNPWYNGLPARSLLYNAITENRRALHKLVSTPLNDALFDADKDSYMNLQLVDANARDVMADVVACALDRSSRVKYRVSYGDPSSRAAGAWSGEMGLCPRWSSEKPSVECLRIVSSCLFARTNRLHRRVPVRFGSPGLPPPRARVTVTTTYTKDGTEIDAFPRGWKPGYVGTCTPNQPFTLSVSDPASCGRSSIRACKNIRGCDIHSQTWLGDKHAACDDAALTFTCPDTGFFSVMSTPDAVPVVHRGPGVGRYPVPEQDVFPFLEGAFFGNLFDPEGLTRTREVVLRDGKPEVHNDNDTDDDVVPHRHIYACYSQVNDDEGVANLNWRVCDKPGSKKCFPNPPRRCHFKDSELNRSKGYHCKWNADNATYQDCVGDDGETYPVITVHLHESCDLTDVRCSGKLPTAPPD